MWLHWHPDGKIFIRKKDSWEIVTYGSVAAAEEFFKVKLKLPNLVSERHYIPDGYMRDQSKYHEQVTEGAVWPEGDYIIKNAKAWKDLIDAEAYALAHPPEPTPEDVPEETEEELEKRLKKVKRLDDSTNGLNALKDKIEKNKLSVEEQAEVMRLVAIRFLED